MQFDEVISFTWSHTNVFGGEFLCYGEKRKGKLLIFFFKCSFENNC